MKILKTMLDGKEIETLLPENEQDVKELLDRMTKSEAEGPDSLADAAAKQAGHDPFSNS